jgi:hypothetical protein
MSAQPLDPERSFADLEPLPPEILAHLPAPTDPSADPLP